MNPACNVPAPYCHLWPVRLHNIFPHYLINCTIFVNVIKHKTCFDFLYNCPKYFSFKKKILRSVIINIYWFSCKGLVIISDFNETWIFSTDFREVIKYQILLKSVQWEPRCWMRTDEHDEASSSFFFNFRMCRIEVPLHGFATCSLPLKLRT